MSAVADAIDADRCLFKVIDTLAVNSELVDPDVPLDEFGAFANSFLLIGFEIIQSTRSQSPNLQDIISQAKNDLIMLLPTVQSQPSLFSLLNQIVGLCDPIGSGDTEKLKELTDIMHSVYSLFEHRLRRVQAQLVLVAGSNRIDELNRLSGRLAKYIEGTLLPMKLDATTVDTFLLTEAGCERLERYLRVHKKPFPKCPCHAKAVVFAYPCNCPCYCVGCWNEAGQPKETICPICSGPISELVVLQPD
jgi:hypothetical protein